MPTNSTHEGPDTGAVILRQRVSISRWVNEPYPPWHCILTAHDVAHLIRRPRWMLGGLATIGQIPRRQRFHGKHIGWLKADIFEWMARSPRQPLERPSAIARGARLPHTNPNQHALPLKCAPTLRGHGSDSLMSGVSP